MDKNGTINNVTRLLNMEGNARAPGGGGGTDPEAKHNSLDFKNCHKNHVVRTT
jgi:hypothetical protein